MHSIPPPPRTGSVTYDPVGPTEAELIMAPMKASARWRVKGDAIGWMKIAQARRHSISGSVKKSFSVLLTGHRS